MTIVETTGGRIEGSRDRDLEVFKGVPYARAPLGDMRLRAPRPPEPWTGVRQAKEFGYWAPQNAPASALSAMPPGEQSEDCLTLNIWTPGLEGRRPVMVWVHGGAFVGGSGAGEIYCGDRLARRGDVVIVTINYRLGVLGFLAHPELIDPDGGGATGNWGLLDQIASLAWVRDNISSFGGDPKNVTVFGESAGGMSVSDLLAVPQAKGLFHRALVQSGPPYAASASMAAEAAAKLAAEIGVKIEDLRKVPVAALLEKQEAIVAQRRGGPLPLTPVVDGVFLPERPLDAIRRGESADIPLMIGTNRDEFKMFLIADPRGREPDEEVVRRRIERSLAGHHENVEASALIGAYRAIREQRGESTDPRDVWSAIESDHIFRVGSIRAAEAHAGHQPRTYCYLFTWESPAMHGALGSCHALELPFVFGTLDLQGMNLFAGDGPAAVALSNQMMDAWISFARDADPGWPAYEPRRRTTMVFGTQSTPEDAPLDEERSAWEGTRAV